MIAGVGHVEAVAQHAQAARRTEARLRCAAVHQIGVAAAELPQHLAGETAFENAMVPGIGDVEMVLRDGDAGRKSQRLARLRAARLERRRQGRDLVGLVEQFGDHVSQATGLIVARHDLAQIALGIDQRDRRPTGDAVVLPRHPAAIVRDREAERHAVDRLQHGAFVHFGIELGLVDAEHGQLHGVTRAQQSQFADQVLAIARARVPEQQGHHAAAMRGDSLLVGVEPMERTRQ